MGQDSPGGLDGVEAFPGDFQSMYTFVSHNSSQPEAILPFSGYLSASGDSFSLKTQLCHS